MNSTDKRSCRHRYRQLIAKTTRERTRRRAARGNEMFVEEGKVGSDDDVLFLNRRNAIKEKRRRGLGLKIADAETGGAVEVGRGVGSQEMPVVFDEDEDEEEGEGVGMVNGGEEMRAIERGGYAEARAAGKATAGRERCEVLIDFIATKALPQASIAYRTQSEAPTAE